MKSTMFLSNLSVVDHAYINRTGNVVGGSFNPSFLVTGETDPVEKVVVDFSTVKKDLKALIDHPETGFDHKLWLLPSSKLVTYVGDDGSVCVTTPTLQMNLPANAVRMFPKGSNIEYDLKSVGNVFAQYLQEEMRKKYPEIEIKCLNNADVHSINPDIPYSSFTYTHGLKDSTSWGCQNIAHGHLSYLQLFKDVEHTEHFEDHQSHSKNYQWDLVELRKLRHEIAEHLDGAIFIRVENVIRRTDEYLEIGYTTGRGTFCAKYVHGKNKIIVLETETTVEFLVEYVLKTFGDKLRAAGVGAFALSEGLTKGAFLKIPNL